MKRLAFSASTVLVALTLAACGSGSGDGTGASDLPANYVVAKSLKFKPKTITVKAGTEIVFDFDDGSTQHNAVAKDKSFDTGVHNEKTVPVTLTKPGRYEYECTLHPTMTGTIIVEP